jgi:hypothetical protein
MQTLLYGISLSACSPRPRVGHGGHDLLERLFAHVARAEHARDRRARILAGPDLSFFVERKYAAHQLRVRHGAHGSEARRDRHLFPFAVARFLSVMRSRFSSRAIDSTARLRCCVTFGRVSSLSV